MANLSTTVLVAGLFLANDPALALADWSAQSQHQPDEQSASADSHWVLDKASNCFAYDAHSGEDDGTAWTGDCRDGRLWGPGTLTFLDHGKMFEKVTGNFSNGRLQDGHASLVWSDGSSYDGEQQNGRFNGDGTLIAADGHRYRGTWKNDEFVSGDGGEPDVRSRPDGDTKAAPSNDGDPSSVSAERSGDASGDGSAWTFLGKAIGASLVGIDGTKLTLGAASDGGLSQRVVRPDGAVLFMTLTPLSARLGTVRDGANKLIATYCVRNQTLMIAFDDGRSETIAANADGGVAIELRSPSSPVLGTDWYPEGHAFSRAERDAALRQYAIRLASAVPNTGEKVEATGRVRGSMRARAAASSHRSRVIAARVAATPATDQTPSAVAVPSTLRRRANTARPAASVAAGGGLRTIRDASATATPPVHLALSPVQPVIVRTSVIHTIDAPLPPRRSASECLTVESNGTHWGFRNRCTADVQFAYCLLNSSDRLAGCNLGSIAGSVGGNAFSALVADSSIKDTQSVRAFRWVACIGGAGEVVPRLVQADPPLGRCMRAAGSQPAEHAEASLRAH
jgi:hypothetical protein